MFYRTPHLAFHLVLRLRCPYWAGKDGRCVEGPAGSSSTCEDRVTGITQCHRSSLKVGLEVFKDPIYS